MTKEEIEAAKRAAFAAKPQIVMDSKKFKGKDRRDEIDRIITPGEEDNLDLSDDELSQVLKVTYYLVAFDAKIQCCTLNVKSPLRK